jgi:hypothetical protein
MCDSMYHVIALIPPGSDFSLKKAVSYFGSTFSGKTPVRSELAKAVGEGSFTGFRTWYGDWSIVAWLDEAPGVLADSQELVNEEPLPAPPEVIGSCSRRLSIWSDEDEDGDYSDEMTAFTDELLKRFGLLIYDPGSGGWWTYDP